MIIGVCGFCSTGSSAVSDYLKEFSGLCTIDSKEFALTYYPDGIEDLEYHLTKGASKYISSVVSIERFRRYIYYVWIDKFHNRELIKPTINITENFINNITQVKWIGHGNSDYILNCKTKYNSFNSLYFYEIIRKKIVPIFERKTGLEFYYFINHSMEFSINPNNFEIYAKKYIEDMLTLYGCDINKTIVLDQPFSGNNPQKSFKYFNNPKAIVVDRDPRDIYVFAKEFLKSSGRQIPTENVDDFIVYFQNLRNKQPYRNKNKNILLINFEDMIYEYEKTTRKIMKFCNIESYEHTKHIFDPKLSINNTQVYKRYPKYRDDISKIEKELGSYLYDFEKYGNITIDGRMFRGKSPLNKQ